MREDRTGVGVTLMITTMFIFAAQDSISRHLAESYNTITVVMIRYWFLAIFVMGLAMMRSGGIRRVIRTRRPFLQTVRSVLLLGEVLVLVTGFVRLGLVGSHAIFACFPLIVTALSVPILGERVGWRRWMAVVVGFVGVLIILRPGFQVMSLDMLIPLLSAVMFALYHVLTRMASREDSAETSFFWTGLGGAVVVTFVGPFFWNPMVGVDWYWMGLLCVTSALGHFLLIQALTFAQASTIQPFSYFQLVFATLAGVLVFGEPLDLWVLIGVVVVVGAGLFAMIRGGQTAR